jgi:hypothetical protein
MRLVGTVAHPHGPSGREAQVVVSLLECLGGDTRQRVVVGFGQVLPERHLVGIEEELAKYGVGKIAVGLLDEQQICELALIPEHRELVFGTPLAFDFTGAGVEGPGDAEMIEGDIAQSNVDLEFGAI